MKEPNCCEKLISLVKEGDLLCLMDTVPFDTKRTPTEPTVYIMSDGGHGGYEAIQFCPFCGTKLKEQLV